MRITKRVHTFLILILSIISVVNSPEAKSSDNTMEKVIYTQEYRHQESVDEELFDEESEYEEYDVDAEGEGG